MLTANKSLLKQLPKEVLDQRLFFGGCLLFIAGLLFSKALLSISMVLLALFAMVRLPLKEKFPLLKKNYAALSLLAFYLLLFPYYFITEDKSTWLKELRSYSILLLFPVVFAVAPPLNRRYLYILLYAFIVFTSLVALGTVIKYFANIEAYDKLISQSKNIETVTLVFHIHFGVMCALSVFFGWYLYNSEQIIRRQSEKKLLLILMVFLFLAVHILAYRTGIIATYAAGFIWVCAFIIRRKRYVTGLLLLAAILLTPVVAYHTLGSVKNRVSNTRYDLNQFYEGRDINHYSMAKRMAAWSNAFIIIKKNWLTGTGPADVRLEVEKQFDVKGYGLAKENRVMLHNQYLHFLVGYGIIGFLLFLFSLFSPIFRRTITLNSCAGFFIVIFSLAMLIDSFFELQRGLYMFVFFYSLLIIQKEQQKITKSGNPGGYVHQEV